MRKIYTLALLLTGWTIAGAQCPQFLNVDTSFCSGGTISVRADASVLASQLCGDSLTIIFNATGTVLAGDTNVYMHSGPEFTPFTGWQGTYTVGHWGQNDGVGRMTYQGSNVWSITINPRTYFNYPVDSCLNGIFMDFRNFDGSISINNGGANYFLYTVTGSPTSTFTNLTGSYSYNTNITYHWSNGLTTGVVTLTTAGNYTVTATGIGGCSATGSVTIKTGHAAVNLGNDVVRCVADAPVTLNAGGGFVSYTWLNDAPSAQSTYNAVNPGCYWVSATDSAGCISSATISVENTEVNNLSIPDSLNTCPGHQLYVDASTNVNLHGDSVVIIYNAAVGQTTLPGSPKVYFHSSPQFYAFQPWNDPYTVGNWGQDDGVGEMTSLGGNLWRIAIDPYCYYRVNPDTPIIGLWMVFRNADGSETGKDSSGNNIYVYLAVSPPTSPFSGVSPSRTARQPLTYVWSDGAHTAADTFTSNGVYSVTLSDNNGCSKSASVKVSFNGLTNINLGGNIGLCPGHTDTLDAGPGYSTYSWNGGSTTETLPVSQTGNYSVTVTSGGCSATGSVNVSISNHIVSIGSDTVRCNAAPITLTASPGFASYSWLGNAPSGNTFAATGQGSYWVNAVDSSGCKSGDTITVANSPVSALSIPDTLATCNGTVVTVNASTSVNTAGDSLTIIYNASQGESGLVGAASVYMHSAPRFTLDSTNWNQPYTIGNWGMDDGLGKMTSLGGNKWSITINPYSYYHIPGDTPLLGIFIVFRNATGTNTGKDNDGNNILLSLNGSSPSSTFSGVTGAWKAGGISYSWSNGVHSAIDSFSTGGGYTVTVSDQSGCSQTASITVIAGQSVSVSFKNDTCYRSTYALYADSGFASYVWNTGASTDYVYVQHTGNYSVTVTSAGGCSASASVTIDSCQTTVVIVGCGSPAAQIKVKSVSPDNTVTFLDSSKVSKLKLTEWTFGDGTTSSDNSSLVHTYPGPGIYTVILTVTDSCNGTSSDTVVVNVNATGIPGITDLTSLNVYPNPATDRVNVELNISTPKRINVYLLNELGETVWLENQDFNQGKTTLNIKTADLAAGLYAIKLETGGEQMVKKLIVTK